jgi:hypothetical protein
MAPCKDHAKSRKSDLPYVTNSLNILFYPAMTAFIDQYSLPNICFDIGQL